MEHRSRWLADRVLLHITIAALCAHSAAEILPNVPFQIVQPTSNHTSLIITDGLSQLVDHRHNISLVSVVGPYHSGKSFLLNALVGDTHVFSVGRKTLPETMGIWICRTEMKASDGSEVWLMDSEGFFGPGVSESYDAKIFTIASLLGGHLVYNTVKIIDQQAVNLLEMLARRAQLFRTRSSAEAVGFETPEFLSIRSFPPLTWVVEDFVQELPQEHRHENGATNWLRSYLTKVNDSGVGEHECNDTAMNDSDTCKQKDTYYLSRLYKDINAHTLFLPATTKAHLQDLSQLNWAELTPEFLDDLSSLRASILGTLEARKFEGTKMTGRMLGRAIQFIVQALQRGMFHELPAIWATWSVQVADMSLQDADTWFTTLIGAVDNGDDPVPVRQFNSEVDDARRRAIQFYRDLLHDFEVNPDIGRLQKSMAAHFDHKVQLYHERIHRWVGDLSTQAKDNVGKVLASVELPLDPESLRQIGANQSKTAVNSFSARLHAFAAHGSEVKYGKVAQMPVFSKDVVHMLTTDLRHIQGMTELENEREIVRVFQMAVAAGDKQVVEQLQANENRLFGKTRMREFQNTVAFHCWQAFDDQISKHKWMLTLAHYRTHRALVQTEKLGSRLSRFAATNDQRLGDHFRAGLDRCVNSYKVRKASVHLPVSETDLAQEQQQLTNSVREMLEEHGKDLADTEAFRGAMRSLNAVFMEGQEFMRQKNVELWKAHSDEATRCALARNHAMEKQCGLLCFFNKLPRAHKSTSHKHLFECFKRSETSMPLTTSMQQQIFETWYSKDLATDVANVWNNFYMGSALLGFCVLFGFWCVHSMPPTL